jgi:spermidine/putrescine ABC transporter ATP-binding subunit
VSARSDQAAADSDFLVLDRLSKRYPNFVAVDSLDLQVAAGEFLTLLGPSGSGKTTTLMMIAGFTPPSAGDIRLKGRSIASLAPERRGFGVVFQSYALFPHMTVAENVAFPLRMRKQQRSVITERVLKALQMVRLEGLGDRQPKQLSGGQQQRVALARALVFDPDVLLMDEPLGALDKNLREQMQVELKRLHRELGVTLLYVTHDQQEALSLSDRIALMQGGRIAQLGTAEDLYERPCSRFVAEFIGESNVIEGMVQQEDGRAWFVAEGGDRFAVPVGAQRPGRSLLVVRPEKLSIGAPDGTGIAGEVSALTYLGDCIRYYVRTPGGLGLTVKTQGKWAREGERIVLGLDGKDARILPDG